MSTAAPQVVAGHLTLRNATRSPADDSLMKRIDDSPASAFALLSGLYAVTFFSLSYLKLLWLDELITLHIARLTSVGAIWRALGAGADPNPPVTHILVHFSRMMLGEHEWALRLPAMLGYWLGLLCLFAYLRKRVPTVWALTGTVLSMTMAAFDYSFESRSYAIFYGLAMSAFYCWTVAVSPESSRRTRAFGAAGMSLSLMAGISTNYFAVLAFLPIAGAEVVRMILRIRERSKETDASPYHRVWQNVDLRICLLLLLSLTPLLAYRSMIEHSIAQFAPHAWNKVSIDQTFDSYTEMVEIILYPLLALFVAGGVVRTLSFLCSDSEFVVRPMWLARMLQHQSAMRSLVPGEERIGIFLFMAYPFLGYVVASIRGGMLSPRFVIPVCFGFAIAGTLMAFRLFHHLPRAGILFLCICTAWFVARESVVGYWYAEQKQCFYKVVDRVPLADGYLPGNGPLVVPDPLMVLTLQHYAPKAIADRIVLPVDFPGVRRIRRDDSPEQNIWAGRNTLYTLRLLPLATFQHNTGHYLILASDGNWLLQDLDQHRYAQRRLPINTRAGAIGGFTPLSHGQPNFYIGDGDLVPTGPLVPEALPIPFNLSANLPEASNSE
jgi:hypothetical protein